MITKYGISPMHDAAVAGHLLRRAIRALSDDETVTDHVGLSLVASMVDLVADALDRQWRASRDEQIGMS